MSLRAPVLFPGLGNLNAGVEIATAPERTWVPRDDTAQVMSRHFAKCLGEGAAAQMHWSSYILIGLAAMAAGLVNALAGGGTLIAFPALVAVGLPAVAANVTSTVALCPGYFGATLAQRGDLAGQRRRLWLYLPAAVVGGLVGGFLLLHTGEKTFRQIVPFLILLAALLLALSDPLRAWVARRLGQQGGPQDLPAGWAVLPVGLAAVYGGYFGAGLSVIVLAILGLILNDTLTRLNAVKQAVGFSANIAAALFFVFSGRVVWPAALAMAVGALAGGVLGGRLAGRVKPSVLRWTVVAIAVIVAVIYLIRG
ncbi:MAG TPA: sulfite exporter TauE/SafE family protein [Anaerolineaceae bacterium]